MEQQQKSCVLIPDAADIDRLSELHKAMGDFTRMKILWALMGREYCVNELATQMNMSESAVSHQLKILKFAKLVSPHKVGKNEMCIRDSINTDTAYFYIWTFLFEIPHSNRSLDKLGQHSRDVYKRQFHSCPFRCI